MKRLSYILIVCLVSGCTMQLPKASVEIPDRFVYSTLDDEVLYSDRWWEIFEDTTLNRLVAIALVNNRDIEIALSRITQARYAVDQARAAYLPAFEASLGAQGDYALSATTDRKSIGQQYSVLAEMSWEVSLFGAARQTTRAARADLRSSEYAWLAARLSLSAEVATAYFQWLQYARLLEISQQSYRLRGEAQQRIDSLFRYGFSSAVDEQQARSLTETAAADIPAYTRAVEQAALAIDLLLGEAPSAMTLPKWSGGSETDNLLPVTLPDDVPAGLPSDLLTRRPDVLQALTNADAAAAKARLARAQRYPSVTLTGEGGVMTYTVKALTEHNPFYWVAAAGFTQPVFSFGRLRRAEQVAREQYSESLATYEQTVLQALSDVENALVAIETYRRQIPIYLSIIDAYRNVQIMTSQLYLNGLSDYLDLIDAERNLYSSQQLYVELLTSQLVSYVNLFKALGGGY